MILDEARLQVLRGLAVDPPITWSADYVRMLRDLLDTLDHARVVERQRCKEAIRGLSDEGPGGNWTIETVRRAAIGDAVAAIEALGDEGEAGDPHPLGVGR